MSRSFEVLEIIAFYPFKEKLLMIYGKLGRKFSYFFGSFEKSLVDFWKKIWQHWFSLRFRVSRCTPIWTVYFVFLRTKLTTGKEHYTSCTLKVAWKWLTMAPYAHGAQVLPDPDFGPKNMIRPPLKQTFPTTFVSCTWKKNENRKNFGQLFN